MIEGAANRKGTRSRERPPARPVPQADNHSRPQSGRLKDDRAQASVPLTWGVNAGRRLKARSDHLPLWLNGVSRHPFHLGLCPHISVA